MSSEPIWSSASLFADTLVAVLAGGVARPQTPLGALCEPPPERRFGSSVAPAADVGDEGVHGLVARQAAATPDAPALRHDGAELSYRDLDARAEALAATLRVLGVDGGQPVGLCAERSFALVVGLLAILKAGGADVPLDPDLPPRRLRTIAQEAELALVVAQPSLLAAVAEQAPAATAVAIEEGDARAAATPTTAPAATPTAGARRRRPTPPSQRAYVLFTSGSTGTPKGVAMSHGPLLNLLAWQQRAFATPGPRRTLQYASIGFDVAFQEIFSTLASGGCLVLVDGDLRRDAERARGVRRRRTDRAAVPAVPRAQRPGAEAGRGRRSLRPARRRHRGRAARGHTSDPAPVGGARRLDAGEPVRPDREPRRHRRPARRRPAAVAAAAVDRAADRRRPDRDRRPGRSPRAGRRSRRAADRRPGARRRLPRPPAADRRAVRLAARRAGPASTAAATSRAGGRTAWSTTSAATTARSRSAAIASSRGRSRSRSRAIRRCARPRSCSTGVAGSSPTSSPTARRRRRPSCAASSQSGCRSTWCPLPT